MPNDSVSDVWRFVQAAITITLLVTDDDDNIKVWVDPGNLDEHYVIALASKALADRMLDCICPVPPTPGVCECGEVLVQRWSRDGAYSVWLCPECRQLVPDRAVAVIP